MPSNTLRQNGIQRAELKRESCLFEVCDRGVVNHKPTPFEKWEKLERYFFFFYMAKFEEQIC